MTSMHEVMVENHSLSGYAWHGGVCVWGGGGGRRVIADYNPPK